MAGKRCGAFGGKMEKGKQVLMKKKQDDSDEQKFTVNCFYGKTMASLESDSSSGEESETASDVNNELSLPIINIRPDDLLLIEPVVDNDNKSGEDRDSVGDIGAINVGQEKPTGTGSVAGGVGVGVSRPKRLRGVKRKLSCESDDSDFDLSDSCGVDDPDYNFFADSEGENFSPPPSRPTGSARRKLDVSVSIPSPSGGGASGATPSSNTPIRSSASSSASATPYRPNEESVDESPHPVIQTKGRLRISRPEQWKCNVAKERRNKGLSYDYKVKKTGAVKQKTEKKVGPPCTCSLKCFTVVGEEAIQNIFEAFYKLADYNFQTAYLQQWITRNPVKRKRTKEAHSKRTYTLAYNVMYKGVVNKVCRTAFLHIHGLTKMRVETALKKLSDTGTIIKDKRGTNPNTKKVSEEAVANVHKHIQMLPVCTNHYSRATNPNRQYLEAHESIGSIYQKYLLWMMRTNPGAQLVKEKFYYIIFGTFYNIGFRPTKKDSCKTCELITFNIANAKRDNKDISKFKAEQEDHNAKVKSASDAMKAAKNLGEDWACVTMDLQQTMPVPRLSVGIAYYKRKLWLYNFCVHDLKKNESFMFLWEETTASRGSVEIGSCLLKYLQMHCLSKADHPRKLKIFADNCGGQNKNVVLVTMLLRLIHDGHFDRIELCYLVSGHSFMACDRSFGVIEKQLCKDDCIYNVAEYTCAIATARKNKPYPVYKMKSQDFFNFGILINVGVKRLPKGKLFSNASIIAVSSEYRIGYLLKESYDLPDDRAVKVSLARAGASSSLDLSMVELPLMYSQERKIDKEKLQDLVDLSVFISSGEGQWLRNLIARQRDLYNSQVKQPEYQLEVPDDPQEDQIYGYDVQVEHSAPGPSGQ